MRYLRWNKVKDIILNFNNSLKLIFFCQKVIISKDNSTIRSWLLLRTNNLDTKTNHKIDLFFLLEIFFSSEHCDKIEISIRLYCFKFFGQIGGKIISFEFKWIYILFYTVKEACYFLSVLLPSRYRVLQLKS
jgi:hypothetical protein